MKLLITKKYWHLIDFSKNKKYHTSVIATLDLESRRWLNRDTITTQSQLNRDISRRDCVAIRVAIFLRFCRDCVVSNLIVKTSQFCCALQFRAIFARSDVIFVIRKCLLGFKLMRPLRTFCSKNFFLKPYTVIVRGW